jgi:hypothetical protein
MIHLPLIDFARRAGLAAYYDVRIRLNKRGPRADKITGTRRESRAAHPRKKDAKKN